MFAPQKFCTVDDTFFITGRGPVIVTSLWEGGELGVGDWIELRSADGERTRAQFKSIEMVRFTPKSDSKKVHGGGPYSLLLAHIDRSLIHVGDEAWSVADPTGQAEVNSVERQNLCQRKYWLPLISRWRKMNVGRPRLWNGQKR